MAEIGVVIVTFNRLEKLKNSLAAFDKETVLPKYILIVNNASTDGTGEWLKEWLKDKKPYRKYVLTSPKNLGGSGGFYMGLKRASELDADWIWVSDDDVYPCPTALETGVRYIDKLDTEDSRLAAVASKVVTGGKIDKMHRRHINQTWLYAKEHYCEEEEYDSEYFEIDILSYAGSIISRKAIKEVGLPEKNFFIWFDDSEHSMRLRKYGKLYCVPALEIEHDVEQEYGGKNVTWKDYYGLRNELIMFKRHYPKRTFVIKVIKKLIRTTGMYLKKDTRIRATLFYAAIRDGVAGRMGVHPVYRPGWKAPEK